MTTFTCGTCGKQMFSADPYNKTPCPECGGEMTVAFDGTWKVASNYGGNDTTFYQVWRQTRALERGEPMHSGVREYAAGSWPNREEAQAHADKLNEE